jgi:hypothetical protein
MRRIATALALALSAATFAAAQMTSPGADVLLPLRVIVVGTEDEARQVVARLERGESFTALARALSLDPSASDGGRLGVQSLAGLRPEIRDALTGIGEGAWTVVPVPTGHAILFRAPASDTDVRSGEPVRSAALAAAGSVKYVADVGGYGAANAILQQYDKPPGWNMDPGTTCRIRTESLAEAEALLARELATAARQRVPPFELVQLHFLSGQLHAYHGRMAEAIAAFEQAYGLAADRAPESVPEIQQALGVVHLHKAGLEHRLHHAPGDRCLLAVRDRTPLARRDDALQAIGHFTNYLASRASLEVRWLLNLAHMAAGSYPDGVPEPSAIPPAALDSPEDVGRFVDVAAAAGLTSFGSAGGAIVDDFDNDGLLDVVTSSMGSCEPMRLFTRAGPGPFTERTAAAGLTGQVGGLNMVQTDYDNDGDVDILLLRGAWELPQRKSLLRNNGDGTFSDVTVASGVAAPATSTQAAVWTDVDRDGFVDLFVGNEGSPAQLFRNRRDGSFEDVAARAGVNRRAFSKAVSAADYDNDGWPDLHVSNLGGIDFLYRNNHDGTFTEVAAAARVPGTGSSFASWFFDYDNDGWQDLFVASYVTSVEETARTYLGLPNNGSSLKLYRNEGGGRFEDVTERVGLNRVFMPMGANFGDIDNDGFLDIYLGTGNPSYAALVPSVLLRNRDGVSFVDVTASSGTGELHKGHGVAFADLDRDGDEDLIFQVGGATPADRHMLRLFENPGHGNDWISLTLTGVASNRAAVGARIAVTVDSGGRRRTMHRYVAAGGSFGSSPLEQHIGLGRAARIVDVEIWWPTTNTRQRFTDVAVNQSIGVTELAAGYVRLDRPRLPLTK